MSLKEYYFKNVILELKKQFGYKNDLAVPRLIKIVINVGLSKALKNKEFKEIVEQNLKVITGQKSIITRAKHAISGFGIRQGLIIGEKVTLRGQRMYDFAHKIINVVMPRIRDFQGLNSKSLDKKGNLTIGLKECAIFPEINQEEISTTIHGLEITLVTNAKTREEALMLFKLLKFPFKS
ncbi:MAG: 50S ribosomal protein L5 [Candidatus Jacksonbacteria bacterium]